MHQSSDKDCHCTCHQGYKAIDNCEKDGEPGRSDLHVVFTMILCGTNFLFIKVSGEGILCSIVVRVLVVFLGLEIPIFSIPLGFSLFASRLKHTVVFLGFRIFVNFIER